MSSLVYRILTLLEKTLQHVPIGTNLGLFHLLLALLSGRFLLTRGAVTPALADLGLSQDTIRRSVAALAYGHFHLPQLLTNWQHLVRQEGHWQARTWEGWHPLVLDVTGFFRPRLQDCANKHYRQEADKALPAVVVAMVAAVGTVGKQRLALPRHLVVASPEDKSEADVQRRALPLLVQSLAPDEVVIGDAGIGLEALLEAGVNRVVVRADKNATFRQNYLPPPKKAGRPRKYGLVVRPLARTRAGKTIAATPADKQVSWQEGQHRVKAALFENLTFSGSQPGEQSLRCVVIYHPRYQEPLVLVTTLNVSAASLLGLYRDRWAVEQLPLAAKQMLGCERAFVFGSQSRYRLPCLALLGGNMLSYLAATNQPVSSGFWDRQARPTCGRLRRLLFRVNFSELSEWGGQVRKKASVTEHLPKGILGHRRQKAPSRLLGVNTYPTFTGN